MLLIVFIFGAAAVLFGKNSVKAEAKPALFQNTAKACGCGAGAACGGTCQPGSCQCGSNCNMNR